MSTKKQVVALEKRLEEGNDLIEKALDVFRETLEAIKELAEDDDDRSEETSGAVSTTLYLQAEGLHTAHSILEDAIEDIVSASGSALYCLQEAR
jgi:hypothetical protein